ncbi:AAA family ATPase [Affinibrenneria salicis]|uniref:AAA family ATPase n=1 Tax=Affinibrenneria salicis TaxID=2590031 RepID=A0A5J5FV15_9GAMM|nr:LuxR C-terminal-related transcriptional regulator [Affinibrenneria salicis]KAA8996627.1 AAA family ATPase [Affinibrenneria salicis]
MDRLLPTDYRFAASYSYKENPFHVTRRLPLILTKFTPPRSPGKLLARDRLLRRLDEAASGSLTLLSAAAGCGKTTLLAQWYRHRHQRGDAIAWLSLEEYDNDPAQFIRYFLAALAPLCADWRETFRPWIEEALPPDFSLLLVELINHLHHSTQPLYLILDDYQNISHPAIHEGMNWLLKHAPAALHLVIGSRFRPPLALSRLQVQDQVMEINDADLFFTLEEAGDYLRSFSGKQTGAQEIQRLMALTEGWVAGLKIAALSPDWQRDPERFLSQMRAGAQAMGRYLEEVIFAPLPHDVFDFLLHTAILHRLTPSLCNAVTRREDGAHMLDWIQQHNLFITELDEDGVWFRYHPLMREALLRRLQQREQQAINALHERAGSWFAGQRLWAEAVRHALAAGKTGARHAEASAQSLAEEGDIDTLVRWMRVLPATPDPSRIDLQLNLAWALAHRFRFNDARQLLDAIERMTGAHPEALSRALWVKLRVVRAICEAFAENIALSVAIVEPLFDEIPCGDIWVDGLVCNILSYCRLVDSRPEQALSLQRRLPERKVAQRNLFVEVYRAFVIAQGYLRQGNLAEAERRAARALRYAERHTGVNSSSGATLAPILAEIAWERGDDERVDALLSLRLEMIDSFCPPEGLCRCYIVLARQADLRRQPAEAARLLAHAGQLAQSRGWSRARAPLLAEGIRLRLAHDDTGGADALLDELTQLARDNQPQTYEGALNSISLALRLSRNHRRLARGEAAAAAESFGQLAAELEQRGERLSAVRINVLQAVALWRAQEADRAAEVLRAALQHAARQQLQSSLLAAGPDLLLLLSHLQKRLSPHGELATTAARFYQQALAIFGPPPQDEVRAGDASRSLTEREQQTLRLIADGYSNKGIARSLGISAETVKWHLKQLYEKLQVSGRIQAVNRARGWHLLDTSPPFNGGGARD